MAAVRAAGLDPDRALSEQVGVAPAPVDESTVRGWVADAVADAKPPSREEQAVQFAERLRDKLVEAQGPFYSLGGGSDAA